MKKLTFLVLSVGMFAATLGAAETTHLRARLKALDENPTNVTNGTGSFAATVNDDSTITFTLTYHNLSTPVIQAHIHVGATKTNGAVAIFLCGPAGSAAHQTCPNDATNSGTVKDTVSAADVVINAEGISPGEFTKVLRAIVNQATYVNVHSKLLPGGEIRGQVGSGEDEDDE
jgi:TPP-dependent trihydroxycyclohexane-1,2-dione (THcHDO) dehydratase